MHHPGDHYTKIEFPVNEYEARRQDAIDLQTLEMKDM